MTKTDKRQSMPPAIWPGAFVRDYSLSVISAIRSMGKGGLPMGFMAMDMSLTGLSSAATRLELNAPHRRQRWMIAHSPFFRTHTATGSISPPQSDARSPGSMSRCTEHRQLGQWFRWSLPAPAGMTGYPQFRQVKLSSQG